MVINDSCENMLKYLEKSSIDLVVTSPPYDCLRKYGNNVWNFDVFKVVANNIKDVLKDGGVCVWVVGDQVINGSESGSSFRQALYFKEIGLRLHDTMIYKKKEVLGLDKTRYHSCFEYMFVLSKGRPKTVNLIKDRKNKYIIRRKKNSRRQIDGSLKVEEINKDVPNEFGIRYNIWEYSVGWLKSYKEEYVKDHPAVMPYKLASDLIYSYSNEGEFVLDPFAGSGTVLVEGIKLKREVIGFEIHPDYLDIINRRISEIKI